MAARKGRPPRLKVGEVGISQDAMKVILMAGGEDMAIRVVRRAQHEWHRLMPCADGMLNLLQLSLGDGAVSLVFPMNGAAKLAVVTPEEAERQRVALTSGQPDTITLHRVGIA